MAASASPISVGQAQEQQSQVMLTSTEHNTGTGSSTDVAVPCWKGAPAVPRHTQLPAVKVSILCPHHLLFTKAYTHLHKQMNNSIMCLAARALSFCCTIEAPHWKDPYTGKKNLSKSPASTHIIKASFPFNTSCFGNECSWLEGKNTNKQTSNLFFPLAGGKKKIEPVPSLLKSSTKLMA